MSESTSTTDFDSNRWTFKKSGPLHYSLRLRPAFIYQEKDFKKLNEQTDESKRLFDEGKIGTLKHLGQLFSFLLKVKSSETNPILTRVEALKNGGKKVRVLDLMGYGSVIRKLDVGGMAVALADARTLEEKKFDKERGVGFTEGDVKSSKTWQEIEKDVEQNGPYDMVLCRPMGGIYNIPQRGILYTALINKMYGVTNPDGGTILTEFHLGMLKKVDGFVKNVSKLSEIKSVNGVQVRSAGAAFCLTRSFDSPNKLPIECFK